MKERIRTIWHELKKSGRHRSPIGMLALFLIVALLLGGCKLNPETTPEVSSSTSASQPSATPSPS